jgi:hypothetical protein
VVENLTRRQLEAALKLKLPSYDIHCHKHSDGSLSVDLTDQESAVFAVTGIVINDYAGTQRVSRLARQIAEDMALVSQGRQPVGGLKQNVANDADTPVSSRPSGQTS